MDNEPNRILDELAKFITNATGTAKGICQEAEIVFHNQIEKTLNKLDLVKREDFEIVKEMAIKACSERDNLVARIEILEKKLNISQDNSLESVNKK